jgi:hypothetical protein
MTLQVLSALAEAMAKGSNQKVTVADLARQASPPDKILLTLLSQHLIQTNRQQRPGDLRSPKEVQLDIVAGCYFKDYRQALAAFDAAFQFLIDTPVIESSADGERSIVHLVVPDLSQLAGLWSSLRLPLFPALHLQVVAQLPPSAASRPELPVLNR